MTAATGATGVIGLGIVLGVLTGATGKAGGHGVVVNGGLELLR